MKTYQRVLLALAVVITVSGQVFAYPLNCAMPGMDTTDESMGIPGYEAVADGMGVSGSYEPLPVDTGSNCEQICGYCPSYNSLVRAGTELTLVFDLATGIDYNPPFIPSSAPDNPFRPPISV